MPIFMKYEGIDGESEVRGRTGYMELNSFSWGLSRATATARGDSRGDAEFVAQDVVVTRAQDSISALLIQEAAVGDFERTVDIEFVRTGPNNKPIVYFKATLRQAGLASYQVASGGDTPTESMTIRYNSVQIASHKTGNDLNAVPNTVGLDVAVGSTI